MMKSKTKVSLALVATLCSALAVACSDDDGDGDDSGGAAGESGSGGGAGKGGKSGAGGSSGSAGKAGASGSGGRAGSSGAGGGGGDSESGSGGDAPEAGAGGAPAAPARIRVLHLSPDAPGVDVFVNGGEEAAVSDLEFPDGTPYLEVPAGTYTFDVAPAGTSAEDAVLSIEDVELAEGGSYTAVAYDELDSISALALGDDYARLENGDIRVRAVHAATGVGEVDIWNVTDPGNPAPLYENLDFGAAGESLDVPAGAYVLGVDTDDDAVPDLTFELPELAAGTVANLFAVADGSDVFLLAQLPDGTTVRVDPRAPTAFLRVLHLSPDAPAVDVFIDGGDDPAVSELAFPDGTGYLAVPAASYDIDVSPAGTSAGDAVLSIDDLALAADNYYTAVALDEVASLSALPLVDDYTGLPAGSIRVRAVHAAPAVGQVDLWNLPQSGAPAPLWTDVDFGVAGAPLDLPAGAYTIGVDVDNDASPDLTFELPALPAGAFVNVFAANDADGDVFLLAQLRDGTTARIDPE
ncbi:MAG TPA: DUF4397 domain-containing protein [Polyangiaceae bacterium]